MKHKLRLTGTVEKPFAVEVIWDDATTKAMTCWDSRELEETMADYVLSQSYGKLMFADSNHVVLSALLHVTKEGQITCTRDHIRIPTPGVLEIIDLRRSETIYKGQKAKQFVKAR